MFGGFPDTVAPPFVGTMVIAPATAVVGSTVGAAVRRSMAMAMMGTGLTLMVAGCHIESPGPRTTQERDVGAVHAVELSTSADLTIRRGPTPSLTVTAGEKQLEHLTSTVEDGVLVLASDRGLGLGLGGEAIEIELVTPGVDHLIVTGSGDVTGDDVTGEELQVEVRGSGGVDLSGIEATGASVVVSGSGDVDLVGTATTTTLTIDGSGHIEAQGLATGDATVSLRGSGDADVTVSGTLDASIGGSGTITYAGDPDVTSRITGSGDVRER